MPGQSKMVSTTTAPAMSAAEQQADLGDGRDHGVAQHELPDQRPRREALRALVGDEVLLQRVQHAGAREAGDGGKPAERKREGRQDEMAKGVAEGVETAGDEAVDQVESR